MTRNAFSALLFACVLALAASAHAQVGLIGLDTSPQLNISPLHPSPGDQVHITVHNPYLDMSKLFISWRGDGKTIAEGVGIGSIDVKAPALGASVDIEVDVVIRDDVTATGHTILTPSELDLLVDSDSYVPPFYRGGARTTAGASILLQAVPRFYADGKVIAPSELIYTWKRNGDVLASVSGLGKSTIRLSSDHLFGTDKISVEVQTRDETVTHEASASVTPQPPILLLYQNHPLYGIMFHKAQGASNFIPDSEMTFTAVPLFAHTFAADPDLSWEWDVNGHTAVGGKNPNEITIDARGSSGIALVSLALTSASNFYLDVKGRWSMTFSDTANAQDAFGSGTP